MACPFTHVIQGDSQLLMVKNQINISTPNPSFGHNLCCQYSNGSHKLILNIYNSRTFQWYKLFNPMNFWPLNYSLNIQVPWDSNIQSESPPRNVWTRSITFFYTSESVNVIPELRFWPSPFHAHYLGCEPKVRVVTHIAFVTNHWILWGPTFFIEFMVRKGRPHMMLCDLFLWSLQEMQNFMSC